MRIMPERKFFGSTLHLSIAGLAVDFTGFGRTLAPGERRLGAFILPHFQRGLVWTETQKVRLIESIYMGLPIGALVYNQTRLDNLCDRWLLDGQQRLSAIVDFMSSSFMVKGWLFSDIPKAEQMYFKRLGVTAIETQIESEEECQYIYDRLVYGGTAHAPKEG